MGAPADATFGRLSICSATRQARILVGLGELADTEARQLHIYVERSAKFFAGEEILPPSAGGRGDLLVLGCRLVGTWLTVQGVPSSLCFIHGSWVFGAAGLA